MAALDSATALKLAQEAYSASTSYFDTSIRKQVESDIRQFQGQHPLGSKYLSEAYRSRSRLFRPKTRSAVRKHEAIAAEAFFSTRDVVNVEPQDDNDVIQLASAEVMKELLQHRLTKTIPWFLVLMGAYQDAQAVGLVCSYQHWVFDKVKGKDEPRVSLRPLENIRFDPGANWMDPVRTSPYFIDMIPMYVKDVQARMTADDTKTGEGKWKKVDDSTLLKAVKGYSDSIRLTREQGRTDPKENAVAVTAYSIVWVHKNIIEHEGQDYCYYTLADQDLLSDPQPIEKTYWHGERPYVIGYSVVEAHKNYPSGPVRLTKDVQAEINELVNQRNDNIRLVLNKRYLVARGKQVDLRSLTRNIAGSVTLVNDIEKDVKELAFSDVTASSYKEQENLNLDFDEASGNFSQSSVQSNRRMNETVGGMQLLTTDANQVSGYQLRTFVETWVEPVLRQLILLEQKYETDEVILALAGQKAKVFERFGIDTITDEVLEQELTLSVSVGMGATNPQEKVNRFLMAMRSLKELLADGQLLQYGLKFDEVCKEVFGNLGYRDGSRFFDMKDQNPQVKLLQQQLQDLQQKLDAKHPQELIDAQVREIGANIDLIASKVEASKAQAVKTGVDASYSAMQAAEVVTAVPQVARAADVIMQGAGYQNPNPAGVDPNFEAGAPGTGGAIAVQPVENHKTGMAFAPGGVPAAGQPGGSTAGDTTPNTPAAPALPATPGTGEAHGIETMRADGVRGMADGGLVGGYPVDPATGLPLTTYGLLPLPPVAGTAAPGTTLAGTPDAINSRAKVGVTINGITDQDNAAVGINPLNDRSAFGGGSDHRIAGYGSGLLGYADGGIVQGPGTGTSDSVPAVNTQTGEPLALSHGEVVIPPEVVQALGADFFEEMIAKFHQPANSTPNPQPAQLPVGVAPGSIVIPADVVAAVGADVFETLIAKFGKATQ